LLATFVVNQVGDAADFDLGDGVADSNETTPGVQISLRSAIQNANLDAVLDNIFFNIPGEGVQVISPTLPLPTITQPVVIDGYMQPMAKPNILAVGSDANILIHLDGFSAGAGSGLTITAGGSTVQGLAITRFRFQGIEIRGPGTFSTIAGNFIGVPPAGTFDPGNSDEGNMLNGVLIINSAGNNIGGSSPGDRNVISGNNSTGVALAGTDSINNFIQNNYIGTNAAGDGDLGNSSDGVSVSELTTGGGVASRTMIGGPFAGSGNLISGNDGSGVSLLGAEAQFNVVQGNRIGTDATGMSALRNERHGVVLAFFEGSQAASNNTIGGVPDAVSSPTPRNIISGNGRAGVAIFGAGARGNKVQNNYIGTNINGTGAIPNVNDGVRLGDDSLGAGPSANFIGGTLPGAGNLISGNTDNGIELVGVTTTGNFIEGNLIGTNTAGNAALPNSRIGVLVDGAPSTRIGGTTVAARNVISGNSQAGIRLTKATATANKIEGNYIGVQMNGISPLGNQDAGVLIDTDASFNMVGGTTPEAGNVIAYSLRDGVFIQSGTRNTVRLNSIHSNGGIGINLESPGVARQTLNDEDDRDIGPNNLQNFPEVLNFSHEKTRDPRIRGVLDGATFSTYTLDFYLNDGADPLALGQGRQYLLTKTVTAGLFGRAEFDYELPISSPLGKFITVTATDSQGNTSEFSHDADADGLYDHWESGRGVDGNNDNTADFFLNNPNPLHKDIYVEVDSMGIIDSTQAAQLAIAALDSFAPALTILNPDGTSGINLHFERDANIITPNPEIDGMADLRAVKVTSFGTRAEQDAPTSANILAAKRMTHRYVLLAPSHPDHGGLSWVWGHEFYTSIGAGSVINLAAVFLHELGHALGLQHGGGDEVNYKPNYHSIMNYAWSYQPDSASPFRDSWSLNYSNFRAPDLDERNLNEADGIGGHPDHMVPVGPNSPALPKKEFGPVDFNRDGDATDTGVSANLNWINDDSGSGTFLTGFEDWPNLTLNFRESGVYRSEFGLEGAGAGNSITEAEDLPPQIVADILDIGFANKAPRISGLFDQIVGEGQMVSFTVPATDPEGDALSFVLAPGAPPTASINPMTGKFRWPTAADDGYGQYIVTVLVTDAGSGRTRQQGYGIVVNDVSLAGDYNANGVVDAADYVIWHKSLDQNVTPSTGADGSGNGIVDQADYLIWRANFGTTLPPSASGSSAVAATSRTKPMESSPLSRTTPDLREVQLSNLSAENVQASSSRINSHTASQEMPAIAVSHDNALALWLASKVQGTRREYPVDKFKDQPEEEIGDASPKALASALDSVFAQQGFFT
jgi:hypothetical protein